MQRLHLWQEVQYGSIIAGFKQLYVGDPEKRIKPLHPQDHVTFKDLCQQMSFDESRARKAVKLYEFIAKYPKFLTISVPLWLLQYWRPRLETYLESNQVKQQFWGKGIEREPIGDRMLKFFKRKREIEGRSNLDEPLNKKQKKTNEPQVNALGNINLVPSSTSATTTTTTNQPSNKKKTKEVEDDDYIEEEDESSFEGLNERIKNSLSISQEKQDESSTITFDINKDIPAQVPVINAAILQQQTKSSNNG